MALLACAGPAAANNYGESVAWQFQTSADKANAALVQDMIQRKKSGMYAAPIYNTHIDRQYNCNVSASAVGNNGSNSTVANSPTTTGASSNAIGNDNNTDVHGSTDGNTVSGNQSNSGSVGSNVNGGTETNVRGRAWQAINSTQTNSGNQTANVSGSTACTFGALN
ncbi:hypothetical protein [Sphingosinicella rhizophila]|uniref:Uncharacterized protein n=1 Tax=Sphingosinicella rhizophila TaxID=3050082 RepID=A0ABU3Q670_9SPHN|nr:hypothetical protein [Sphingosinicella sp. GR2756]MDT9598913.1 hypothetical protein [Sphingosinicella sp. GR2756]